VNNDDVIHKFWSAAIELFEHFQTIINTVLFLSFSQKKRHPTTCNLSQVKIIMENRFSCCRSNLKNVFYLLVCDMWINVDQLKDSFDVFWSDRTSWSTRTRFIFKVISAPIKFSIPIVNCCMWNARVAKCSL
jgi:hypothetical protein